MTKVYENRDFPMVGHFQSILESEGIRTEVRNEAASSLAGELPFTQTYPELWVLADADVPEATRIIEEYFKQSESASPLEPWTCPSCASRVDADFGECWNCQTQAPNEA